MTGFIRRYLQVALFWEEIQNLRDFTGIHDLQDFHDVCLMNDFHFRYVTNLTYNVNI